MDKEFQEIAFKQTARLLIVASILCVFFGNGIHIHAMFDHGDVHAFVHSHSGDQTQSHSHSHAKELDDKDTHQHPTATVDLTATLIQKVMSNVSTSNDIFSSSGILNGRDDSKNLIPLYLDLPPPDLLYYFETFPFYTTRGPPLG